MTNEDFEISFDNSSNAATFDTQIDNSMMNHVDKTPGQMNKSATPGFQQQGHGVSDVSTDHVNVNGNTNARSMSDVSISLQQQEQLNNRVAQSSGNGNNNDGGRADSDNNISSNASGRVHDNLSRSHIAQTSNVSRMDEVLVSQVYMHQPFAQRYGQKSRKWDLVANNVLEILTRENIHLSGSLSARRCQTRFKSLMSLFNRKKSYFTQNNPGATKYMVNNNMESLLFKMSDSYVEYEATIKSVDANMGFNPVLMGTPVSGAENTSISSTNSFSINDSIAKPDQDQSSQLNTDQLNTFLTLPSSTSDSSSIPISGTPNMSQIVNTCGPYISSSNFNIPDQSLEGNSPNLRNTYKNTQQRPNLTKSQQHQALKRQISHKNMNHNFQVNTNMANTNKFNNFPVSGKSSQLLRSPAIIQSKRLAPLSEPPLRTNQYKKTRNSLVSPTPISTGEQVYQQVVSAPAPRIHHDNDNDNMYISSGGGIPYSNVDLQLTNLTSKVASMENSFSTALDKVVMYLGEDVRLRGQELALMRQEISILNDGFKMLQSVLLSQNSNEKMDNDQ